MFDVLTFFPTFPLLFLLKSGILILCLLYLVFSIIIMLQARSFHKVIYIGDSQGSSSIQFFLLLHLIAVISLFLLALAIL